MEKRKDVLSLLTVSVSRCLRHRNHSRSFSALFSRVVLADRRRFPPTAALWGASRTVGTLDVSLRLLTPV